MRKSGLMKNCENKKKKPPKLKTHGKAKYGKENDMNIRDIIKKLMEQYSIFNENPTVLGELMKLQAMVEALVEWAEDVNIGVDPEFGEKLKAIETEVAALKTQVSSLQEEVDSIDISGINEQITALGTRITELKTYVDDNVTTLSNQIEYVDNKVEANKALIDTKQDKLTFDITPTENSQNPVTSGGIYSAIKAAETLTPEEIEQLVVTLTNDFVTKNNANRDYVRNDSVVRDEILLDPAYPESEHVISGDQKNNTMSCQAMADYVEKYGGSNYNDTEIKTDINKLTGDVSTLETQQNTLSGKVSTLETQQNTQQGDIEGALADIAGLEADKQGKLTVDNESVISAVLSSMPDTAPDKKSLINALALFNKFLNMQEKITEFESGTSHAILDNGIVPMLYNSMPTSQKNKKIISASGIEQLLSKKQDTLTFDTTPTENSENPVTSGGIYSALQNAGGGGFTGMDIARQFPTVAPDGMSVTSLSRVSANSGDKLFMGFHLTMNYEGKTIGILNVNNIPAHCSMYNVPAFIGIIDDDMVDNVKSSTSLYFAKYKVAVNANYTVTLSNIVVFKLTFTNNSDGTSKLGDVEGKNFLTVLKPKVSGNGNTTWEVFITAQ